MKKQTSRLRRVNEQTPCWKFFQIPQGDERVATCKKCSAVITCVDKRGKLTTTALNTHLSVCQTLFSDLETRFLHLLNLGKLLFKKLDLPLSQRTSPGWWWCYRSCTWTSISRWWKRRWGGVWRGWQWPRRKWFNPRVLGWLLFLISLSNVLALCACIHLCNLHCILVLSDPPFIYFVGICGHPKPDGKVYFWRILASSTGDYFLAIIRRLSPTRQQLARRLVGEANSGSKTIRSKSGLPTNYFWCENFYF